MTKVELEGQVVADVPEIGDIYFRNDRLICGDTDMILAVKARLGTGHRRGMVRIVVTELPIAQTGVDPTLGGAISEASPNV